MWDRGSVQQVTPSAPCMGTSATCRWGAARQSRTSQQKPHGVKAGGALGRSDETAEDDEEAPALRLPAPLCGRVSPPGSARGQDAVCRAARARTGVGVRAERQPRGSHFQTSRFLGWLPHTVPSSPQDRRLSPPPKTANSSAHWLVLFSPAAPSAGGRHRVPSPPTHRTACDPPQTEPFISETSRCPSSQHLFPATFPGLGAPLGQAGSRMKRPPG